MEICSVCQGTKHIKEVKKWNLNKGPYEQDLCYHTCHRCNGTGEIEPTLTPLPKPEDGEIMTLVEYIESCMSGCLIDSDGSGYYATDKHRTDLPAFPSHVSKGDIFTKFSHVCWYNK